MLTGSELSGIVLTSDQAAREVVPTCGVAAAYGGRKPIDPQRVPRLLPRHALQLELMKQTRQLKRFLGRIVEGLDDIIVIPSRCDVAPSPQPRYKFKGASSKSLTLS